MMQGIGTQAEVKRTRRRCCSLVFALILLHTFEVNAAGQRLSLPDFDATSPSITSETPMAVKSAGIPVRTPGAEMPPSTGPAIEVTLSRPIYHITHHPKTGAPQMPKDVTASAYALRWPVGTPVPKEFTWRVYLDWDYARFPTHHPIQNETFQHASPFPVNFGETVRGGALTVVARVMVGGRPVFGKAHAVVLAENPDRSMILRAFPRSRFGLIASKVAMFESEMKQFTPACGDPKAGLPTLSPSQDLGIMQLNVPTGSITSEDQIWDWRANVRQGLEILAGKRHIAFLASRAAVERRAPLHGMERIGYLNMVRALLSLPALPIPSVPPLSDQLGSGLLPDDKDDDHLRLSQAERDAIRRYNGGCEYSFELVFDPAMPTLLTAGWIVDSTRGGISSRSGDPDYVRHVLMAHSGFKLDPPQAKRSHLKPKRHKERTLRERRRSHH